MGPAVPRVEQNRFGPDAHATDYPPVFVTGRAPESFDSALWRNDLYIVNQSHFPASLGPGLTALHLDGAGVFEGAFRSSPADLTGIELDRTALISRFGAKARGAMALYVADARDHELLVLPDPMSAAIIFTYRSPALSACSSSLRALARVLRAMGVALTKSAHFFVELLASEAGGYTASSYEEIDVAPMHSYVQLSAREMQFVPYPAHEPLYQPDVDYQELLSLAVEEIVENAALSATVPGTLTSHLTAGADSRLVGAALHAAGVDDKFVFFCGENAVTREQDVARRIAGHMGWTMTKHPGVNAAYSIPGEMSKRQATLEASEGIKSTGPTEGGLRARGIVLTGYNGEAIRSFYSGRVEKLTPGQFDADTYLKAIWPQHLWDSESGLVEPHALDRIRDSVEADIEHARASGIPTQTIGDYLYFKARNRYFAWHSAMESGRYRAQFTPLYSPAMVRLAMSVPLSDRIDGRITYDLYQRLAPKALEIPFDSQKFWGGVQEEWKALPRQGSNYQPSAVYDNRKAPVPSAKYPVGHIPAVTREHVERARKLTGVTAADIAGDERYRRIVRTHALVRDTPIKDVLREDSIRTLTNREANTRSKVRTLARLTAYLPWYTDAQR